MGQIQGQLIFLFELAGSSIFRGSTVYLNTDSKMDLCWFFMRLNNKLLFFSKATMWLLPMTAA